MTHHLESSAFGLNDDLATAGFDEPAPVERLHDLRAALDAARADAGDLLGLRVDMHYTGLVQLPAQVVGLVDDIVREALDNVARHARTSWVRVDVSVDDELWLRVRDHGCGFQLATTADDDDDDEASRFAQAARRVSDAGGTLLVMSAPREGTIVRLRLPIATG